MSISPPLPSFERAEYDGDPPKPDECAYCHRGLDTEYFRVNGHMACAACARQAQSLVPPDSHKAYSQAVLFGVGAAILGCIGYSVLMITTGWTIGYAALAVGYMVGKSMKAGSRGLGGKRYQITAAVLTYAAVAVAFVPLALHMMNKKEAQERDLAAKQTQTVPQSNAVSPDKKDATSSAFPFPGDAAKSVSTTPAPASVPAASAAAPAKAVKPPVGLGGFLLGVLMLLGIGLVSPVIEIVSSPGSGLIGAFILFIGVSAAWKLTRQETIVVEGPFEQPLQSTIGDGSGV